MSPLPEIQLSNLSYTVDHWLTGWRHPDHANMFDLNAPYQRGSVWTVEQRQNLIKSLLMGLPVGNVIISALPYREGVDAHFRIVDGKQRIEALQAFFRDEFPIPAEWLHEDKHTSTTAEVFASDLTPYGVRSIGNSQMGACQFDAQTEFIENPEYDSSVEAHRNNMRDIRTRRYLTRERTDEEILRAEAELYLLVNFGGVDQTDDDRARAEQIAGSALSVECPKCNGTGTIMPMSSQWGSDCETCDGTGRVYQATAGVL